MEKLYTVVQQFAHGSQTYAPGPNPVALHHEIGAALKNAGLVIDYAPANPPEPVREQSSASRPGRRSIKQTLS
jgi:hypothetical protein